MWPTMSGTSAQSVLKAIKYTNRSLKVLVRYQERAINLLATLQWMEVINFETYFSSILRDCYNRENMVIANMVIA